MWPKLFNLTKIRSCKCYLRLLYEFELSVLKNIEQMTEDCTVKEV